MRWLLGSVLLLAPIAAAAAEAGLKVYPYPPSLQYSHHNDDFTVQARTPEGSWQDLYEWNVRVDLDKPQDASMVYFDFTGRVEIRIQKNNGRFSNVTIGPRTNAPKPSVKNGIVHLTLDRPQNLAVFFDDDRLHNLHIFAGAPIAPPAGGDIRRLGPGLHRPDNGANYFTARSGETVYLEGGAVLVGGFNLDSVDNVRIVGRGLILPPGRLSASKSTRVSIEGPIVITPDNGVGAFMMSKDVSMVDVKAITGGKWTDGINIYSSERITLDRLFMRTSDDCVTVYAHRWESYGDARDIKVTNSTLWPDIAHAMFVGMHGNTVNPETIERVTFDNIDVVSLDEDEPEYEGVMAITAGDSNLVRDVTFSNIRVDRIEEGKLFNLHVGHNAKYNTSAGRGIEKIAFRNVSYAGEGMPSASVIFGVDANRMVRDVLIENLVIGGKKILDAKNGDIEIGPFAEHIQFK